MKEIKIDVTQMPKEDVRLLSMTFLEAVKRYYSDPENLRRFEESQKNKENN